MDANVVSTEVVSADSPAPLKWYVWACALLVSVLATWAFVRWIPGVCPSRWSPYLLAKLLLISPVLEEAAFRGGLHTLFLARAPRTVGVAGVSLANLLTSILFAATYVWFVSWVAGVAILVPSLALGWVFDRWGKLWPCILLHGAFNAIFMLACVAK